MKIIPLAYRWLALIVLAVALMGFGWVKGAEHVEQRLLKYQAQIEKNDAAANKLHAATALKWRDNVIKAQNAGNKRAQQAKADADAATAVAGSLQHDLDQFKRDLPTLTRAAVDKYAVALDDVFGQCTGRYTTVAEKATGHAGDVRTLSDAWPK